MAVVPIEQNRVGLAEKSGAKFRAPDYSGSGLQALGVGLKKLASAGSDYALTLDDIQDSYDETYARQLALEYKKAAAPILSQYQSLQGQNAVDASLGVQESLQKAAEEALARAGNPQMRTVLERLIAEPSTAANNAVAEHSLKQQSVMAENTLRSEMAMSADQAAGSYANPDQMKLYKDDGLASIDELAALKGWSKEDADLQKLDFTTKIHRSAVDAMLSTADPNIDLVTAYVEAHADEMTQSDLAAIGKDIQQPLQLRMADKDFTRATQGLPTPEQAAADPETAKRATGWAGVATDVAKEFGLDPNIMAAVMSYETGGTFNPKKMGGKDGKYMGLIQFGEWERGHYGINANSTPEQWTKAIKGFLNDRGFKKGMSGLDLYSTINAGQPGRYDASDGNGTVRSHYDKIISQHMGNAKTWLGNGGYVSSAAGEEPREWDKDAVYNQIDTVSKEEGWTFERVERAKRRADQVIARDEELKARQERSADEEASKIVLGLGDGFTSVNQIPAKVRDKMSPSAIASYTNAAASRQNAIASAAAKAKSDQAEIELELMKVYEPEKFKALNLGEYVGSLDANSIKSLAVDQAKLRTEKPADWSPRSGIVTALTYGKRVGQLKLDAKDEAAILKIMESEAQQLYTAKGKKPLSEAEYAALFKSATGSIATINTSWYGGEIKGAVPRYEATPDLMTDAHRKRLTEKLKKELGRDPNPEELTDAYRLEQRR